MQQRSVPLTRTEPPTRQSTRRPGQVRHFYHVPRQSEVLSVTSPRDQSLPRGFFRPMQTRCTWKEKWDHSPTSSALTSPRQLTVCSTFSLQCHWNLEIPRSTNRPPLWRTFCSEFTVSDVHRPDLHLRPPPPGRDLFAFDRSTCWGYFQLWRFFEAVFTSLFCSYVALFYML